MAVTYEWGKSPFADLTSSELSTSTIYIPGKHDSHFDYPFIESDKAIQMMNTQLTFNSIIYDRAKNQIDAYTIEETNNESYKIGDFRYTAITQELLDNSEIIYIDKDNSLIMHVGYYDCEIIGYTKNPNIVYILRIID